MRLEPPLKLVPDSLVGPVADFLVARDLQVEPRELGRAHAVKREAALVTGVNQLFRGWLDLGENSEPCERVDAVELGEHAGRDRRPAYAVKAVASGDEIALQLDGLAAGPKADRGRRAIETVYAHVFSGEKNPSARGQPRVGQVFDDFVLPIDGDRLSAGQCEQIDTMAAAPEAQFESAMDQALAAETFADAGFVHQVDGALLEHAGAHALLDVLAAAILDHHGFDAGAMQQMREHQSRRSRPDYSDLRAHFRRSSNLHACNGFLDSARASPRLRVRITRSR